MLAAQLRRVVEAAPRHKLPEIAALLWRAYGEGHVTEDEAATLDALIATKYTSPKWVMLGLTTSDRQNSPRTPVDSRPVSVPV